MIRRPTVITNIFELMVFQATIATGSDGNIRVVFPVAKEVFLQQR